MNHPKNSSLRTPAISTIRYESFRHWPSNLADNEIINEFLFTIENPPKNRVALSFTCTVVDFVSFCLLAISAWHRKKLMVPPTYGIHIEVAVPYQRATKN